MTVLTWTDDSQKKGKKKRERETTASGADGREYGKEEREWMRVGGPSWIARLGRWQRPELRDAARAKRTP